jgi:hypothetical protein
MRVIFHPEFPNDVRKFKRQYCHVSDGLALRFEREIDGAIEAISAFLRPPGTI